MNLFSLREKEIFQTLKELKECSFVIIGGYAVNAYTLPRFSVDCDVVVKDNKEKSRIEAILLRLGYRNVDSTETITYSGNFARYEKKLENQFAVSIDLLWEEVSDRMTGATFSAEWVFQHAEKKQLKGKTITEELLLTVINIDALLVMKNVSARATDIRDVFMMLPKAKDLEWIKVEVSQRCDFNERIRKITEKVASKQFKDGLAGVYGQIEEKMFEKHLKALIKLANEHY